MADAFELRSTPFNNRDDFKRWLKLRKTRFGGTESLSGHTQNGYIRALERSFEDFRSEYGSYGSAFEINSPGEILRIKNAISAEMKRAIAANEPTPVNANTHRNFISAAGAYKAFLDGEGAIPGDYTGGRFNGKKWENRDDPDPEPVLGVPRTERNLIFFGAPGTGKSYLLNKEKKVLLNGQDDRCIRVTFHPDYTYAHFVGTYKPKPEGDSITYKYVPGPFIQTYVKARKNPDKKYLLIIEEINRANVAAVFGDVFQLLDRKDGESEYPVRASEDLSEYLEGELGKYNDYCYMLSIPKNMYIWATMNSADQGVFPMDTAFKRRWDFEYLGIDTGATEDIIQGSVPIGKNGKLVKWNFVRQFINDRLAALGINEDKQLGAFFINSDIIANASDNDKGTKAFKNTFKNKVLMYLFEDAAKHKRDKMFVVDRGKALRYSEICKKFDDDGMFVFQNYADPPEDGGEQGEGTENTDSTVAQTEPSGEPNQ